jgi:hypothetical protein
MSLHVEPSPAVHSIEKQSCAPRCSLDGTRTSNARKGARLHASAFPGFVLLHEHRHNDENNRHDRNRNDHIQRHIRPSLLSDSVSLASHPAILEKRLIGGLQKKATSQT